MHPDTAKLLEDARRAAAFILEKTDGKSLVDYRADELLRAAVERRFEINGEALNRMSRRDPDTLAQISDDPRIIAFRNVLVHG